MMKYRFKDLQAGGYSSHETIEGLFDMLKEDSLKIAEDNREDVKQLEHYFDSFADRDKVHYILQHEYEIAEEKQ
jgi:hypothetical protein